MREAVAMADALQQYKGDYRLSFQAYERNLRPHIEEVQAIAEYNVKTHFLLKTKQQNKTAKYDLRDM